MADINMNPFNYDIKMSDLGGSAQDYATGLNSMENKAFEDYLAKASGQDKPLDLYTKMETDANIPQLKTQQATLSGQIGDLEDTLRRLEGNVNATTQNSYVTEAQRQGILAARKQPLQENLSYLATAAGRTGDALTAARSDIGTKVGLAMQGQQQELDPYKERINLVSNQAARMMTGFTSDRETRLNILMDKLQAQRDLSLAEWQEANQLAREEREFNRQKETISMNMSNQPANTQVIEVGGNKKLIDATTGKIIADYGGAKSTGSGYSGINSYYGGGSSKTVPITSLWG